MRRGRVVHGVSDVDMAFVGRDGLSLSIAPAYVDGSELVDGSGTPGETVRAFALRIERAGKAKVEYWPERTQARARADRLMMRPLQSAESCPFDVWHRTSVRR